MPPLREDTPSLRSPIPNKLFLDLLLRKCPCLRPQHIRNFLPGHGNLLGADGNEIIGEGQIVVAEKFERQHVVVDVVEDEGAAGGVGRF